VRLERADGGVAALRTGPRLKPAADTESLSEAGWAQFPAFIFTKKFERPGLSCCTGNEKTDRVWAIGGSNAHQGSDLCRNEGARCGQPGRGHRLGQVRSGESTGVTGPVTGGSLDA
jgi:hypothetical protein